MNTYSRTKWSIWSILTLAFVLALFLRMSTAVISDNLSQELGFNSVQISNIASCALYSYAFMQIPAGLLVDRYGVRKVSSIGIIIAGVGCIIFGLMRSVEVAYLSRLMVGAGTSVIILSIFKIQGNWFDKEEFASATTKFSFIGNLGSVFATFPLVFLNDFIGWRNSFIFIGCLGVIIGILIYVMVKDTPKEFGYNVSIAQDEFKEKIKLKDGLKSVFSNKATWYNSFIMFSLVGVSTAFTSLWGVRYITEIYGVDKSVSAFIVSFFTYGFVFGSIFMNILFNKIKGSNFKIVKIGATINLVIWIAIVFIFNVKPPIILLPFVLFFIGCTNMSHLQAFNDVKHKNKEKYSGLSTSIVNASEFIGSGLINLTIGIIMEKNISNTVIGYKFGFTIFIVMSVVTIISATIGEYNDSKKIEVY